jgi:cytochrome b561
VIKGLASWAKTYTDRGRYSPIGIAFHWVMAALVLFQLGWGLWADWLLPGGDKVRAYQVHSGVGLAILILAIGRVAWRTMVDDPYNDADKQGVQTTIAHITTGIFYVTFFALPLSGWVMWSAIAPPGPLYVAGVIPWPQVPLAELAPAARFAILDLAEDVHVLFVIVLFALLPAHVGAALKHHFWDRHDVLRGILPEVPDWQEPERPADGSNRAPAGGFRQESPIG